MNTEPGLIRRRQSTSIHPSVVVVTVNCSRVIDDPISTQQICRASQGSVRQRENKQEMVRTRFVDCPRNKQETCPSSKDWFKDLPVSGGT